jgi:antitoxin Phd
MAKQYSVAKARQGLAALVHDAEAGSTVEVTRRGRPVAVLLSASRYRQLERARPGFWSALEEFRRATDLETLAAGGDFLEEVRDRAPGRDVEL